MNYLKRIDDAGNNADSLCVIEREATRGQCEQRSWQ
jgi:hypothetical protein